MNEIKPVAYFRATKEHGIIWSENCCCEDPVFDLDDDYDGQTVFSLLVYSADVVEALQAENAEQAERIAHLEYKIDELMLEYCPDEMTPEQLENYAKHQRKAQNE